MGAPPNKPEPREIGPPRRNPFARDAVERTTIAELTGMMPDLTGVYSAYVEIYSDPADIDVSFSEFKDDVATLILQQDYAGAKRLVEHRHADLSTLTAAIRTRDKARDARRLEWEIRLGIALVLLACSLDHLPWELLPNLTS